MADGPGRRSLRETYTLENIRWELLNRLAALRRRLAASGGRRVAGDGRDTGVTDGHAVAVGRFYDEQHEAFMAVYGEVIQAFRTHDVAALLDAQADAIGLAPGQRLLDAGCGVGAPAVHFARRAGVRVEAITVSRRQWAAARERVARAGLEASVNVVHGDYHHLTAQFGEDAFDAVCFLESFGHSRAKTALLGQCWRVLRPGGVLYVKDLFRRPAPRRAQRAVIAREIRRIDAAYHYEVGDLNRVLDAVRGLGFHLDFVRSAAVDLDAFEGLAISNEFQRLTGIAPIADFARYVFPVDFFELRAVKPGFDPDARPDRHYLQQLAASRRPD